MLTPLRCLVVDQAAALDVISPAYDALTPDQRAEVAHRRPRSWLNVTASPVRPGQRGDDPALIRGNRRTLEELLAAGVFREVGPALFLYRLSTDDHSQTAIVGHLPLTAAGDGRLMGHERSQPDRVTGLAANLAQVAVTSSPVAATWRHQPTSGSTSGSTSEAVTRARAGGHLLVDVTVPGDVRQQVWAVTDADDVAGLAASVSPPPLFIVDGHHRTAAAQHYRASHKARSAFDDELLVAAFSSSELQVASFHRLVHLDSAAAAWWERRAGSDGVTSPPPLDHRTVAVVGPDGLWLRVELADGDELDVTLLHRELIEGELGVAPGDPRLSYVPGSFGLDELARRARTDASLGFALAPSSLATVLDMAEAGRPMPTKATFFYPKVRSGVFVRLHDPADRELLSEAGG